MENENLKLHGIIDRTAEIFLGLNPRIPFEGGIDGAMLAAVKEIEKLRVQLIESRAEYLNTIDENPGCSAWTFDELSEERQDELRRDAASSLGMEEPRAFIQLREQAKYIKILEEEYREMVFNAVGDDEEADQAVQKLRNRVKC